MKKRGIITIIVISSVMIFLYFFNRLTSDTGKSQFYAEVKQGEFEISVTVVGELFARNSIDIQGPGRGQRRYIRSRRIKILDLIPEGTIVNKGDYVATLDRTELANTLQEQQENLDELETSLKMKMLDTAVALNALRNEIVNQRYVVEEAEITLDNSKYEPPATIRKAEIDYDKAQRVLDQKKRNYIRLLAQNKTDIMNRKRYISRVTRRINEIQEVLSGFTVTAPEKGMVIYKREWNGEKRKVGSMITLYNRVVATLPDLTSMVSKTYVSEIEVGKIKTGQRVNITIDAYPDKVYTGRVLSVAKIGEWLPNTNEKMFEVQITMDKYDSMLRPTMTTSNKITIRSISNAIYVPIECVHAGADSISFVYTKHGNKQIVILGEANAKNIIIKDGLEPGTKVYLNSPGNPEKFKMIEGDIIPFVK